MFYSNRLHTPDKLCDCNQRPHNGLLEDTAQRRENVEWFRAALTWPIKLATADCKRASAARFPRHSRVSWYLRLGRDPSRTSFGASGWNRDKNNYCHGISAE